MELNSKKKNTMDDVLNEMLLDINCRKRLTMDDLLNEIQQQHSQETRPKSTRSPMVNVNRPQHRYEADGSEEDEIRVRPSTSGRQQLSNNAREAALSNKYRELERTEARLKQIEQIMRLMEEHELNGDSDGTARQISPRKASNEELANSHHALNTQVPLHIRASSERPANFEPRHLRRSEASNHRNMMEGSGTDSSSGQPMSPPSICSEPQNIPTFEMQQAVAAAAASAQSPAYDSFSSVSSNGLKESFLKTLQSNFDTMVSVFDNQMSPQNTSAQNQVFHLMMMQNYQIMQQQQMLLYWFQQNQQTCQQTNPQGRPMNICQRCSNGDHASTTGFTSAVDGAVGPANAVNLNGNFTRPPTIPEVISVTNATLNNQVAPGLRANNYWDNFKSNSRQNQLSANASSGYNSSASKSNESLTANPFAFNANFGGGLVAAAPPPSAPLPTPNNELSFANAASSTVPTISNYRSSRRPKKAANATQVPQRHTVSASANDNGEKVQNATVETITKQIDLSALYTVLEKFVNDESNKRESKKSKVKPNNLLPSDQQGAVGGEGVSSTTSDQHSDQYPNLTRQPLHISPSTGAIRKKPRNQEFDHAKQQSENSDEVSHNETIRPLMAAEGRSSESRPGLVMTAPTMPPSKPPSHLLLKRPPTTGANRGRDDNDDSSTTDDDLAEADQTAVELSAAEAEPIHSNNNNNNAQVHGGHIPNLVQNQPDSSMPEDQGAVAIGDIDDDEDNMSTNEANEDGIRLSGDGEQGL